MLRGSALKVAASASASASEHCYILQKSAMYEAYGRCSDGVWDIYRLRVAATEHCYILCIVNVATSLACGGEMLCM